MANNKKKNSKVKKSNVKEFPVKAEAQKKQAKAPKVKEETTPLEKQKKQLDKKRVLYVLYTIVCFIVVLAVAGVVGYYATNSIAAESQKYYASSHVTAGMNMSLSQSPMYGDWWYGVGLYPFALLLILVITGKDRLYHLAGFGLGFGGAMFLTYYMSVRTMAGLSLYFTTFRLWFCTVGAVGICLPFAIGILVLVIKILRYNHLVKKGVIREYEYLQYQPLPIEESK